MPNTISMPHTVKSTALTEGTFILVRGNIEFSRLLTPLSGDALKADQERRRRLGQTPIDKPYTSVTVTNARIVPLVPGTKSTEETYVEERFYKYANDPADAPWHYQVLNKGSLPNTFYRAAPGKTTEGDQIYPEHELASGLDVILLLRVFQAKGFTQRGIGLNAVILQEDIRYYRGNNEEALRAAGIILNQRPNPNSNPAQEASATTQTAAAPATPAASAAPAPGAPVTPFATEAPAQPEGAWTCANCGTVVAAGAQYCSNCGQPKPTASNGAIPGNPYGGQAQGGIRYGGDNGRNY